MQDGFVFERIAADHVHMNVGTKPRADFGMAAQIGHGAFNFGPPHEAQRALWARQGSTADQSRQHASRFQNGHATAAVIVCSRPLMVQMAAVNYFAAAGVGPGNDAAHDGPMAGPDFSFHFRAAE